MKIKVLFAVLGLVVISAQAATTNVCYVAAGETKSVSDFGYTFADGDVLKKTGPGLLKAVNNTTVKYNIDVAEGVYQVPSGVKQKGWATLWVRAGATLDIPSLSKEIFPDTWTVYLAGSGVGTDAYLGAISMGDKMSDCVFGAQTKFYLMADATIYTYGTMNPLFSGSDAKTGSTLYMENRTLTLRGKDANAVFRPRWKWAVNKPGKFIVQNGQFSRHKTTNVFSANIPGFTFTEGAQMQSFTDTSMWNSVDAFTFDYGTKIIKGANGEAANPMTLKNVTGAPEISSDVKVTLSGTYTARGADLAAEHILTSATTLTFADGCKIAITDLNDKSWTKDVPVTIATASSIVGTPTLVESVADKFTLTTTTTSVSVTPNFTVVSLASWGIQPGEANAEANAAALANNLSKIVDGTLLIVPSGDYYFGETFDMSGVTAANVILQGAASATDAACIHSTIKLGAATNFKIENVTVKGVNGPAVIATGTQGLTINSLTADAVVGTYGVGEEPPAYPFVFDGVTDLKASCFTATNCGANKWTDQALYLGEGSQTEDSALREGEIVVEVLMGKSSEKNSNWYTMVAVTNAFNLKDAAYANKTLAVTGDGATLDGTVNLIALGVTNLVIRHGQYVARSNRALGVLKSPVEVKAGASLTIYDKNEGVNERRIRFAGEGVSADTPAIRLSGDADWNKVYKAKFEMTGDATIYNNCTGECGTFVYSKVYANGHTLTLKGVANSNYRFGRDCLWYGGGEVVVKSGVTVSSSTKGDNGYVIKEGAAPKFTFEGTSKFIPDAASIFNLIQDVSFANTATLTIKNATTPFDWTFVNLKGAPIVNTRIPSLTVTGTYLANNEDLVADKPLTLNGAFVWGAEAVADVDNADGVKDKTFIQAEGGITKKAKPGEVLKAANYTFYWAGTTTQKVGLPRGMKVLVR